MKEEQLEQFKIAEKNQLYQFIANLDQNLLNIYSIFIIKFNIWEKEKVIKAEEVIRKKITEDLLSIINDDLNLHLYINAREMKRIYINHIKGDANEEVEKESFKSDCIESKVPVIFNKSDFEDIDKLYNSTEKYRRFEFETLGSEVDVYNNTFKNHGYIFMIDMNTWLINIFSNIIDKMIETIKNSEDQEEIKKIINGLLLNTNDKILKGYKELFNKLADGIYDDIVKSLNNKNSITKK